MSAAGSIVDSDSLVLTAVFCGIPVAESVETFATDEVTAADVIAADVIEADVIEADVIEADVIEADFIAVDGVGDRSPRFRQEIRAMQAIVQKIQKVSRRCNERADIICILGAWSWVYELHRLNAVRVACWARFSLFVRHLPSL